MKTKQTDSYIEYPDKGWKFPIIEDEKGNLFAEYSIGLAVFQQFTHWIETLMEKKRIKGE